MKSIVILAYAQWKHPSKCINVQTQQNCIVCDVFFSGQTPNIYKEIIKSAASHHSHPLCFLLLTVYSPDTQPRFLAQLLEWVIFFHLHFKLKSFPIQFDTTGLKHIKAIRK